MKQGQQINFRNLQVSFSIYDKCLSYDFYAIMLNDTLDDPSSTYIPTTWRPMIERQETLADLFQVMMIPDQSQLRLLTFKVATQFANIRPGIFENLEGRIDFLTRFVKELNSFLQTQNQSQNPQQTIFANRQLYKEFIPILLKLNSNFQLRDI